VGVTFVELDGAAQVGLTIKLLAAASPVDGGVAAAVLPSAVPADSSFGRTDGVTNRIAIEAVPLGTVEFAGPGAGGEATSSAVLGDLLAVARGLSSTWAGLAPADGPVIQATDPLGGEHRWLAVIPAAVAATPRPSSDPTMAEVTETGTSLVIRTRSLDLTGARATVARFLAGPDADATLYPIDG
jgi:hypothetical protein